MKKKLVKGSKEAKDFMAAMRAKRGSGKKKKSKVSSKHAARKSSNVSSVLGGSMKKRKVGKVARGHAAVRKHMDDTALANSLLASIKRAKPKPANRTKKPRGRAYGQVMPANASNESAILKSLGIKTKPKGIDVLWTCGGRVRTGCGKGKVMNRVYL